MKFSMMTILALLLSAPMTAGAQAPGSDSGWETPGTAPQEEEATPTSEAVAVLAQFDHEPTVLEVQDAASRYGKVHPEVYESWASRAAWANVLPERMIGYVEHTAEDDTNVRTATVTNSQTETLDRDAQLRFRAWVEWDLTRLIFNPDEYSAASNVSRIVSRREDLLTTINKLYFARRELQALAILTPASSTKKAIKYQIQLAGLTADLDALTGGWFSQRVAQGEAQRTAQGNQAE